MKKSILLIALIAFATACKEEQLAPQDFREGEFYIEKTDNYGRTDVIRIDSLQIETYRNEKENGRVENITDTLYIKWKDNFNYTLEMKSPITELDKEIIKVRINKFEGRAYEFSAIIGYSNYEQKGVLRKKK